MDIALRRMTEDDLPYVLSAERDQENNRFVHIWPEDQHRAVLTDEHRVHVIIDAALDRWRVGCVILARLKDENRNVAFMRIVVTE